MNRTIRVYFSVGIPALEPRGADRLGRTHRRAVRRECTCKEKAMVRAAGSCHLQLADRYRFPGARRRPVDADRAVFGHGQCAQNDRCDGGRYYACADALIACHSRWVDGTAAARATRSGSVPSVAVAIRLPMEKPGAEVATGRWPSGPLHRRLILRFRTTTLSKTPQRPSGRASSPEPLSWGERRKKRKH